MHRDLPPRESVPHAATLLALAAALSCLAPEPRGTSIARAQAAQARLTAGGSRARSGIHSLRAGFSPDPFEIRARPRGSIHVAQLGLGAGCRGYVSAEPDVIVRLAGATPFLRFFARSSAADLTLVVADPAGRHLCNDDVVPGRTTNPMVDVYAPRAGQYDVWIGTHEPNRESEVSLFVTTRRDQRP